MEKIILSHSIVYVLSGHVEIETFEYEHLSVSDSEMLFMPRDSYLISDYLKDDKDMEVYIFFFDHSITEEFLKHNTTKIQNTQNTLMKLDVNANIRNYIASLKDVNYLDTKNIHLLKIKIFELLHLIAETNKDFISTLQAQEKLKTDVQSYMLEHYDKNLTLSDWASMGGESLSTFNRKFKKRYGLTPKKWMLQQNMKLSLEFLEKGYSVTECASEFGYANSSNFIKAFKEIHKKTPKQYFMN